jgi:molybdopterin-guanine dinucleotide biosynthesis protein A
MQYPCSGVILAGGLNRRFSGKEKAFLQVDGQFLLDRLYNTFASIFQEIILVTNDPLHYLPWDLNIVTDIFKVRSSLTGIHAGLFYSTLPHSFIVACDTPFLKKDLVQAMVENIDPRFDAMIPETSAGMEPLCAVYSKKGVDAIERHLSQNKFKIRQVFKKHRIKTLSEKFCRTFDPDLSSFFNINTPRDHSSAEKRIKEFI